MSDSDATDDFLDRPQLDRLRDALSEPPTRISHYELIEKVGEGGFGVVYRAAQAEPVVRTVAVKLLKLGMDSEAVLKRFDLERQALASMNHPGIAQVFDAGISETGQHYFVMEFVEGSSITDYADAKQLNSRARLDLFTQVCAAVTHAHQKGILHRDIKPSNVLVTEIDGRRQVKVIDFGIAKAMEDSAPDATRITRGPMMIGTPEYMSPEQATGSAVVDTRTDVYAMGVLLYELLSGRLPFEPKTLQRAAMDEVFRIIREEDPPKPSSRLSSVSAPDQAMIAKRRSTVPTSLIRTLRQELEWIPLKAMRKDPEHRYSSARDMGEDVRNYLAGHALAAGPETRSYRLRKFMRKYRWPVAAGLAIAASLVAGVIGTSVMAVRAAKQQRLAEERFDDVRSLAHTFIFDIYESIKHLGGATPAVEQLVDTALTYLEKLEASAKIEPDDDLWLEIAGAYLKLADVQGNPAENNLGDPDASITSYTKARDIYRRWLAVFPDDRTAVAGYSNSFSGIAEVQAYQGDIEAALESFHRVLELGEEELERWSDAISVHRVFRARFLIGSAQHRRGDENKAQEEFQAAVDLIENWPDATADEELQTDLATALGRLGQLQVSSNEHVKAEASLGRAVELLEQISASHPDDATRRRNLAIGYDHMARFHLANGEPQKAVALFEKTSATFWKLAELDPGNARTKRDVMFSLARLGDVFQSLQRFEDARASYDRLVELADENYRAHPIFDNGLERAKMVELVARLLVDQESFDEAIGFQRRVIELREQLWSTNPDNAFVQQKLAFARRQLGRSLLELSRPEEALEEFTLATSLSREQYDESPDFDGNVGRMANSLLYAGKALLAVDRESDASERFQEAIELQRGELVKKPQDTDAAIGLAVLLVRVGESLATLESKPALQESKALIAEAIGLFKAHENELSPDEQEVYARHKQS